MVCVCARALVLHDTAPSLFLPPHLRISCVTPLHVWRVDLFRVCVDRQFGLERNGTLTHLNLRSCSLGTNGCRAVLVATRSARALTFLNVAMNGIGYTNARVVPERTGAASLLTARRGTTVLATCAQTARTKRDCHTSMKIRIFYAFFGEKKA